MKQTLTRDGLREAVYGSCRTLSRAQAREICDHVIEEIVESLARGESVRLHEFGVFKVRHKRARLGRNPRTLVDCTINARQVVVFKPSQAMIARLNSDAYRHHDEFELA